ncbi:MAG TPA: PEP-CTERM sorting domain-containing protein [Rhizomicrobium sp.]
MVWNIPSRLIIASSLALLGATNAAFAEPLGPSSGFLPTYAGVQNGDLDVAGGEVFFDGGSFEFDATFNDAVGTTLGVFYVWGVDRGSNAAPFGAFRPGVLFDAVVVSAPSLNLNFVVDLATNVMTPFTDVVANGNVLTLTVPASLLPSLGFLPKDYLVNLWPRLGFDPSDNTQIAEFAPSNSDAGITGAPEPATLALFGAGVIAFGRRFRKQR